MGQRASSCAKAHARWHKPESWSWLMSATLHLLSALHAFGRGMSLFGLIPPFGDQEGMEIESTWTKPTQANSTCQHSPACASHITETHRALSRDEMQPLPEHGSLKIQACPFSTSLLVNPIEKERKHNFVGLQIEYSSIASKYGLDWSWLVLSMVSWAFYHRNAP